MQHGQSFLQHLREFHFFTPLRLSLLLCPTAFFLHVFLVLLVRLLRTSRSLTRKALAGLLELVLVALPVLSLQRVASFLIIFKEMPDLGKRSIGNSPAAPTLKSIRVPVAVTDGENVFKGFSGGLELRWIWHSPAHVPALVSKLKNNPRHSFSSPAVLDKDTFSRILLLYVTSVGGNVLHPEKGRAMNTQKAIRLLLIAIPIVFILSIIWHGLAPFLSQLIICLGILLVRSVVISKILMKPRPPIPSYQPPQQAPPIAGSPSTTEEDDHPDHRYQQGYQAQVKYEDEEAGQPKQARPIDYEQPEAQYPEQLPPVTII